MRNNFKIFLIVFLFINFFNYGEILYKVSGKVVYNGNPVADNLIICEGSDTHLSKEVISDKNGNFYFYVPNGTYKLSLENAKGFVSGDLLKLITVDNKNVKNIIFFLEKGGTISGYIKFKDSTPIVGASVFIANRRGGGKIETDENGYYKITSIRAFEKTSVKVVITNFGVKEITNLSITEGDTIDNLNCIIQKDLSIFGKLIDKDTKNPLINVDGFVMEEDILISLIKTDENGDFKVYNIKDGTYLIYFLEFEYKFRMLEIKTISNKPKEILIELEKKEGL